LAVRVQAGLMYVGHADGGHEIRVFDLSDTGVLRDMYPITTQLRGSDWIDIEKDQRTM
jgi:hypothetical protein